MARNETIHSFASTLDRLAGKPAPATIVELIFNRAWLAVLLLCAGMTVAAHAQQYYVVDCTGANPNAIPTINLAVQNAAPGSYIVITGPCNENVVINNALNLNVGAYYGSTVTINGSISVTGSNTIFLYGLNVTNPSGDAFSITSSHNVTLWTSTGNGNLGHGLTAQNLSDVAVWGPGSFDNNGSEGILVNGAAIVALSTWGGPIDISNNHGSGVWMSSGSLFSSLGNTTIENNGNFPGAVPQQRDRKRRLQVEPLWSYLPSQ